MVSNDVLAAIPNPRSNDAYEVVVSLVRKVTVAEPVDLFLLFAQTKYGILLTCKWLQLDSSYVHMQQDDLVAFTLEFLFTYQCESIS
jgi:hypothetical protein